MAFFHRYECPRRRRQTEVRTTKQTFIPSSLECFNDQTQTLNAGNLVEFSNVNLNTGISFTKNTGENFIDIVSSGVYAINFSANITSTANTACSLAIAVNDVANPISQIVQNVSANDSENVKTQLLLKVVSPDVKISVLNNGTTNFDISNANLSIIRTGNF